MKSRSLVTGLLTGVIASSAAHAQAASLLTGMKGDLAGTVKFMFQPAEEGPPEGERGGAELMIEQGVLENPKVDVAFGLHVQVTSMIPRGVCHF